MVKAARLHLHVHRVSVDEENVGLILLSGFFWLVTKYEKNINVVV